MPSKSEAVPGLKAYPVDCGINEQQVKVFVSLTRWVSKLRFPLPPPPPPPPESLHANSNFAQVSQSRPPCLVDS